jgi:hypothetical protein
MQLPGGIWGLLLCMTLTMVLAPQKKVGTGGSMRISKQLAHPWGKKLHLTVAIPLANWCYRLACESFHWCQQKKHSRVTHKIKNSDWSISTNEIWAHSLPHLEWVKPLLLIASAMRKWVYSCQLVTKMVGGPPLIASENEELAPFPCENGDWLLIDI